MKNNKGFIAISLIYSFFLVFLMMLLSILIHYTQERILLNDITKEIQESLTNTKDFEKEDLSTPPEPSTPPSSEESNLLAATSVLGSYVSMTPAKTSYNISKELTGYTSNQTINPSELNLWRVIKINEDGTIEMVSEYVSSTEVYFYGEIGYKNLVGALNEIAAQYANDKYTIATRHMGYKDQTLNLNVIPTPSICGNKGTVDNSLENKGCGDVSSEVDNNLVWATLRTYTSYKVNTTTKTKYWLATRSFWYNPEYPSYGFSYTIVNDGGGRSTNPMYSNVRGTWKATLADGAIRPIVTLKSGITASSGLGTKESPYILN